jgi:plasmid stabilization system protein ParE
MNIPWSVPAAGDLERFCAWIERDSPEAARRVAIAIYERVGRLAEYPMLGRQSKRLEGYRELIFPPLPYVVVYRLHMGTVEIARVYHAKQNWP